MKKNKKLIVVITSLILLVSIAAGFAPAPKVSAASSSSRSSLLADLNYSKNAYWFVYTLNNSLLKENRKSDAAVKTDAYGLTKGWVSASSLARSYANQIKSSVGTKEFVKRLYWGLLDRPYDQGGFDFWVGGLSQGDTRSHVIDCFIASPEFKSRVAKLGLKY